MKQSMFFYILSMALAVSAAPTASGTGCNGGGDNDKQVCCIGGGLLPLTCTVQLLGAACDGGDKKCCTTNSAQGGLVNINALNCAQLL